MYGSEPKGVIVNAISASGIRKHYGGAQDRRNSSRVGPEDPGLNGLDLEVPARTARARADELLERFTLADTGAKPVAKYSGGMRRRLDLAASLIVAPEVLFVDEPTTGLDPQGRRDVWAAIRDLVDGGTTVLLTTQYLEEADQLADRIAMLTSGRVVAEGTPEQLKSMIGGDRIDIVLADAADLGRAVEAIRPVSAGEIEVDAAEARLSVPVAARTRALMLVAAALTEQGIEPVDVVLRRPTLDEVFLHLTGVASGSPADGAAAGGVPPRDSVGDVEREVAA
jgi:ABC-2 type transport system ATP-binding protein